jgi:hypothetical protein
MVPQREPAVRWPSTRRRGRSPPDRWPRAVDERPQRRAGAFQLAQTPFQLLQALLDEIGRMRARGMAAVADGEDLTDLAQRQPGGLGLSDECDAAGRFPRVVAVAVCGPSGGAQEARSLVVAQGLRRDAGDVGQLADPHGNAPFRCGT